MPNRQKFIGNAEALIELLNDMLNARDIANN